MLKSRVSRLFLDWGPAVVWAAFIYYLSSRTWDPEAPALPINDKIAHFILYGILGAALAWGGRAYRSSLIHSVLILIGCLYAVSDEWHQALVPLRDSSAGDLVADGLGIFGGFLIFWWASRRPTS